jgi:hypothetical protein
MWDETENARTETLAVALTQARERLYSARQYWAAAEARNEALAVQVLEITAAGEDGLAVRRTYLAHQSSRKEARSARETAERIFDMMMSVAQAAAGTGLAFDTTRVHIYGDWERVMFAAAAPEPVATVLGDRP